jgi:hypothetical protein
MYFTNHRSYDPGLPTLTKLKQNASMQLIRGATEGDVARMAAIARAAYVKYVPRIGREPPPMLADFAADIAAGHAVVLERDGTVEGYLISWPRAETYFIDLSLWICSSNNSLPTSRSPRLRNGPRSRAPEQIL